MYNAPSVIYPVRRPLVAGGLSIAVWLAGLATTWAWWIHADAAGWRQVTAALTLVAGGFWAWLSWRRSPRGQLAWDGVGWTGPDGIQPESLEVTLDLQWVLLVRWRTPASTGWLWLERRHAPARWLDLRRAVYSRARPPAQPPARPPAAIP